MLNETYIVSVQSQKESKDLETLFYSIDVGCGIREGGNTIIVRPDSPEGKKAILEALEALGKTARRYYSNVVGSPSPRREER